MFAPKVERKNYKFNLDDSGDRKEYDYLMSRPDVKILSKQYCKHTESTGMDGSVNTTTENHLYVETEECSL